MTWISLLGCGATNLIHELEKLSATTATIVSRPYLAGDYVESRTRSDGRGSGSGQGD
jgi:hypothetical protein